MSTSEVLEFVRVAEWPAFVLGLAVIFRTPISGLIDRIRIFRAKFGEKSIEIVTAETTAFIDATEVELLPVTIAATELQAQVTITAEAEVRGLDGAIRKDAHDEFYVTDSAEVFKYNPVPGVQVAVTLDTQERQRIRTQLVELGHFAHASLDFEDYLEHSRDVVERRGTQLAVIIRSLSPAASGAQGLWIDTPRRIARGYTKLEQLYITALSEQNNVTPTIAFEYDRAAKTWSTQYVAFIENALQVEAQLPQGVRAAILHDADKGSN
ncbi:hypothetical protein [Nocardia sp. NPDC050175]|uniref:hypothetical protein n=1 Tax=Nocardia sp. NPDC050175 TaxID=3364317 RepID=UPI0037B56984